MTLSATSSATSGATSAAKTVTGATGSNAITGLGNNFNDFLTMLMTQLKNQDPTSPADPNQFTSQLVQFASVEQQINANSNLTQLIQLTQGNQLLQGSSMVGKTVTASTDSVALANGSAPVDFTAPHAGPVNIAVYNSAGAKLREVAAMAAQGANEWNWDGKSTNGNRQPDGSYKVVVTATDTSGGAVTLPTTITGIASGVQRTSNGMMQLMIGNLPVDYANVQSVAN